MSKRFQDMFFRVLGVVVLAGLALSAYEWVASRSADRAAFDVGYSAGFIGVLALAGLAALAVALTVRALWKRFRNPPKLPSRS